MLELAIVTAAWIAVALFACLAIRIVTYAFGIDHTVPDTSFDALRLHSVKNMINEALDERLGAVVRPRREDA